VRPQSASGRACGKCTLCCQLLAVEALDKPAGQWCWHARPGEGCAIYACRPTHCQTWSCAWLTDIALGDEWYPARARMVVHVYSFPEQTTLQIDVDPRFPGRWRREPWHNQIRQWAYRRVRAACA
jgi:hypothetical protein